MCWSVPDQPRIFNSCQNSISSPCVTYHLQSHFPGWRHPRYCSSWTFQHRSSSPRCCCAIRVRGRCSSLMNPCWSGSIVPASPLSMPASNSMYRHHSRCVRRLHWPPSWKPFPEEQSDEGEFNMYWNGTVDSICTSSRYLEPRSQGREGSIVDRYLQWAPGSRNGVQEGI